MHCACLLHAQKCQQGKHKNLSNDFWPRCITCVNLVLFHFSRIIVGTITTSPSLTLLHPQKLLKLQHRRLHIFIFYPNCDCIIATSTDFKKTIIINVRNLKIFSSIAHFFIPLSNILTGHVEKISMFACRYVYVHVIWNFEIFCLIWNYCLNAKLLNMHNNNDKNYFSMESCNLTNLRNDQIWELM